jgi:NTP pyrophosphatase (non-canonical NTP hydrolase)
VSVPDVRYHVQRGLWFMCDDRHDDDGPRWGDFSSPFLCRWLSFSEAMKHAKDTDRIRASVDGHLVDTSETRDVAARAVASWGARPQLRQVQEECAELIAAINRDARGRPGARENLIEEAGQVGAMLEQMRIILGADVFDASVRAATEQLAARLDRAERRRAAQSDAVELCPWPSFCHQCSEVLGEGRKGDP